VEQEQPEPEWPAGQVRLQLAQAARGQLLRVPQQRAREERLRLRELQERLAQVLPQWERAALVARLALQLERLPVWRLRARLDEAALHVRAEWRPRAA
jgi:hypothetical protein